MNGFTKLLNADSAQPARLFECESSFAGQRIVADLAPVPKEVSHCPQPVHLPISRAHWIFSHIPLSQTCVVNAYGNGGNWSDQYAVTCRRCLDVGDIPQLCDELDEIGRLQPRLAMCRGIAADKQWSSACRGMQRRQLTGAMQRLSSRWKLTARIWPKCAQ